ncbi:tripartite tricarboxylate transporter TctB family protein [Pontivivens ytuae]|uniref:Tripartite tricarboxylate transporter TctB family protein n=1 Tax=Pontivivens ytuae TaxID=2789856 RepID=A0A7S9QD50_9RHOB|nr:tripartite tricarboxylate transporter TctB family protein [Pontivivens ytuae]QPH54623.1 tripartite tricarboxylate transporter TctB family protein [Pontivivens ytuae]
MIRSADFWTGLCLAVVGAALLLLTYDIRLTEAGLIGPRFVPQAVCVLLIAGGLALAFGPTSPGGEAGPALPWRAAALVAVGIGHVVLTPLIGYLATSAAVAGAAVVLFGARDWRVILATMLALPLALHLIFIELMGVFMPRGRWFDLLALLD